MTSSRRQTILATILFAITLNTLAQTQRCSEIKLIIIKPDTALVDKSFHSEIDSIELAHLKTYYQCSKPDGSFEKDFQLDKGWKTAAQLLHRASLTDLPNDVRNFKYYEILSEYSASIYRFYCDERKLNWEIVERPKQSTSVPSLTLLSEIENADYILFFKNIHTAVFDRSPVLKLTTAVYSKKQNKIIIEKETEADIKNLGALVNVDERNSMWNCGSIKLLCLLVNGVRTSTNLVSELLLK
jgi:hypothetical protein